MKNIVCCFFLSLVFIEGIAQNHSQIQWKSWQELDVAMQSQPKPVFIFFHAKWCAYCKKIDREIFTNKEVVQILNNNYYSVRMDVELTDSVFFAGKNYTNKQAQSIRNGVHEIALLLAFRAGVSFSLPATVILNNDLTPRKRLFEYYTSSQLLRFL